MLMKSKIDHILLIGFGGPEKPEDLMPFLEKVTLGKNIPKERLKSVAHHYELIGGSSPYNPWAYALKTKLKAELEQRNVSLPVYLGMRNWHPFLEATVREIFDNHHRKGVGIILAAHRNTASCKRYKSDVAQAITANGIDQLDYEYLPAWHKNPLFIQAQSDEIKKILLKLKPAEQESTQIIFTCHSIPVAMLDECDKCFYEQALNETCSAVAHNLNMTKWKLAYQSRSGNPQNPWLEPDICEFVNSLSQNVKNVLVVPVGFLCDNAEVLYDLDIATKQMCIKKNIGYYRAKTITHHPGFVKMLAALIQEKMAECDSSPLSEPGC